MPPDNQHRTPTGSGRSSAGSSVTSSRSSCGGSVSVSPMSCVSNQLSSGSSDGMCIFTYLVCLCFVDHDVFSSTGLLREILREVQASNNRVAELEKKLEDLQEGEKESCAGKKKKVEPSPEVRVRVYVHVYTWMHQSCLLTFHFTCKYT